MPRIRFHLPHARLDILAVTRAGSLSLAILPDRVYSFDRAGRLISLFERGVFFRRGLDGRLLRKSRGRGGSYDVATLPVHERDEIYTVLRRLVERIQSELGRGRVTWDAGADPAESRWIADSVVGSVGAMDPAALALDAARFREIYSPVAILPPDQYLALVLQLTEGCSYNRCRFCHFYRDRSFRVKTPADVAAHMEAVVDFFGPGISLRRSLFLGDANALVGDPDRVLALLDLVAERFLRRDAVAGFRPRGIFSFIDSFHTDCGSLDVWNRYRRLGLHGVYLGVETGSDELLAKVEKPSGAKQIHSVITLLKAAKLRVGVIIITGLGGKRWERQHVLKTRSLLTRLPLDSRDLVFFSPYVHAGSDLDTEFEPLLSLEECAAQSRALAASLRAAKGSETPKIARYSLSEFIY